MANGEAPQPNPLPLSLCAKVCPRPFASQRQRCIPPSPPPTHPPDPPSLPQSPTCGLHHPFGRWHLGIQPPQPSPPAPQVSVPLSQSEQHLPPLPPIWAQPQPQPPPPPQTLGMSPSRWYNVCRPGLGTSLPTFWCQRRLSTCSPRHTSRTSSGAWISCPCRCAPAPLHLTQSPGSECLVLPSWLSTKKTRPALMRSPIYLVVVQGGSGAATPAGARILLTPPPHLE